MDELDTTKETNWCYKKGKKLLTNILKMQKINDPNIEQYRKTTDTFFRGLNTLKHYLKLTPNQEQNLIPTELDKQNLFWNNEENNDEFKGFIEE